MEKKNSLDEIMNDLVIVSKMDNVDLSDFENVIQMIDGTGSEVNYTYEKFIEIFDKEGLSGFIL